MTLGDRHLSDPPGAMYSNPYCLSPSYHDPSLLDHFTDPSPKASSPMPMLDPPRYSLHQGSSSQSQPQMHSGSHANGRPHTIHGGTSEMRRLMETSGAYYEPLYPFTDEVSLPSMHRISPGDPHVMRGSSPVDLSIPRRHCPSDRIGTSNGMSAGHMSSAAAPYPHHSAQPQFITTEPQRTSSETSGLDPPLDMAFLDIPGGSPTHNTPPWTPRSNAFADQEDPLMQPLPQLDAPTHSMLDLGFPQHTQPPQQAQPPLPSQPQRLQQQPVQLRTNPQHAQHAQQHQPFRSAMSLPRASSNGGSMSLSGVRDDSALHRRTHSPALSDAGMPAAVFSDGGRPHHASPGPTAEQRSLSHVHSMPARVEDGSVLSDLHVQDTFGGTFAIHPPDPPRAELSGVSREKSLRLLHNSITAQPNDTGGRGSFQPVSLNSFSHWGMQPHPNSMAAPSRSAPQAHGGAHSHVPGVPMQPMQQDMLGSAHPAQPTSGNMSMIGSDDGSMGRPGGSMRDARGLDGPPTWQHRTSDGSGGGSHMQSGSGGAAYNARQSARMLQQITMPGSYSGPQMMYGVPTQSNGSFNAMYIGVQPSYGDHHGGSAAAQPGGGPYPADNMFQMRGPQGGAQGGPAAVPGVPAAAGCAVHEGTQRGGTALRKLQSVTESAARPVMLRAAPMGRTAPRRPGGGGSASLDARSKRSAMTLSEMVAKADAVPGLSGDVSRPTETSLHSSSKRTRTSNGTALHPADAPSVAGGQSMHTNLTGVMDSFGVGDGGGSTHGRSRRSRMGLDPKDEWSLDDWVNRIAREEGGGCEETEAALRAEFLDWETRSKSAPNGKWRGANSRKWGKVGIEMRLTGSVPRTDGPVTQLGRMVCKFVDVVEAESGHAVLSPARPLGVNGGGGQTLTPRTNDGSALDERQVSGTSGQESAVGGMAAFLDDSLRHARDGPGPSDMQHWRPAGRAGTAGMLRNPSLRASGRSFSAMQAMEGDEKFVWRLAEIVDKQAGGIKTVLKEKVWLGTYHTPINAAVHHDFYKVVLAVEGCIFTSVDVPTCSAPTGKKKSQKLKLNFPLDDLPELMYKAVRFTQLWNKYKQDAERYVFRSFDAAVVRTLVQELIDKHCVELRKHVANNDPEGTANTVERRSTRTRATVVTQRSADGSGELVLD